MHELVLNYKKFTKDIFEILYIYSLIAIAELPSLLPIVQLSEGLLRLCNGPHLLARLLANMPDSFDQGVCSLSSRGGISE